MNDDDTNRHGKPVPVRVLTCRRSLAGFPIAVGSIVEVIVGKHDDHSERTRGIDGTNGEIVGFLKGG